MGRKQRNKVAAVPGAGSPYAREGLDLPVPPLVDGRAVSPRIESRRRIACRWSAALLLLAVVAVFGQTAGHGFVNFDDDDYVYENRHVKEGLTDGGSPGPLLRHISRRIGIRSPGSR